MPTHENKKARWNYTVYAEQAYGDTYQGRRLISRDTDVRGGVYYGTYRGEAIVVDPEKYPEEYDRYYHMAAEKASPPNGQIERSKVLRAVFDTVASEMAYSQEDVDKIVEMDGEKIELSMFMNDRVGVCRHQALACAAILEMFKDQGHIRGDISVDRNQLEEEGKVGGHAWTRYTSKGGHVMILDVAQGYFGLLNDVDPRAHWDYLRPEEKSKVASFGRSAMSVL